MIPGLMGKADMIVREEDLVSRWPGMTAGVLSTPRLIQLLEAAAIEAIQGFLGPDQISLGTFVKIRHLAPTPLGMRVMAHAVLKEVDHRRLLFWIDAHDELEKVAEGEHERILVSRERFLERIEKKRLDEFRVDSLSIKRAEQIRPLPSFVKPSRMKRFEVLDHTADIGLIIYGKDLPSLFEHAGEGFFHLITDLKTVKPQTERRVELESESLERLMVDWLSELLYLHEVDHLLFKEFRVESIGKKGLKAVAKGETFRDGIHIIKTGVKAVTHHQIRVEKKGGGWRAQVIFDL